MRSLTDDKYSVPVEYSESEFRQMCEQYIRGTSRRERQHEKTQLIQAYLKLGFYLFPANELKQPRIKRWQERASTEIPQINAWLKQWPDMNIAVTTGKRSGIIVLDVDVKGGICQHR